MNERDKIQAEIDSHYDSIQRLTIRMAAGYQDIADHDRAAWSVEKLRERLRELEARLEQAA